jgi:hypothetical protein
MKNKKLLLLAIITITVILAAGITSTLRAPQITRSKDALFPELANRMNDVTYVDIKGKQESIQLRRIDNTWVIANADNYPALFGKVKSTVVNLSELRIIAEKTDNPELYSKLGVEDPETNKSKSLLLTLKDRSNQEIASIIVGVPRYSKSARSSQGLYVRKPDQAQTLLVEGVLNISIDITDWFDKYILDIPVNRVREISIRHPDGDELKIGKRIKEQSDFKLQDGLDGDKEKSVFKIIFHRIGTALEELRADGVRSANQFTFPDDTVVTTFKTFDGIIITAQCAVVDEKSLVQFSFGVDNTMIESSQENLAGEKMNVREESRMLNDILSEWVYEIPEFKYEDLTKRKDSLVSAKKPDFMNGGKLPINPLQKLDFPVKDQ